MTDSICTHLEQVFPGTELHLDHPPSHNPFDNIIRTMILLFILILILTCLWNFILIMCTVYVSLLLLAQNNLQCPSFLFCSYSFSELNIIFILFPSLYYMILMVDLAMILMVALAKTQVVGALRSPSSSPLMPISSFSPSLKATSSLHFSFFHFPPPLKPSPTSRIPNLLSTSPLSSMPSPGRASPF